MLKEDLFATNIIHFNMDSFDSEETSFAENVIYDKYVDGRKKRSVLSGDRINEAFQEALQPTIPNHLPSFVFTKIQPLAHSPNNFNTPFNPNNLSQPENKVFVKKPQEKTNPKLDYIAILISLLFFVSFILHLIGLSSTHWAKVSTDLLLNRVRKEHIGLWRICVDSLQMVDARITYGTMNCVDFVDLIYSGCQHNLF